MGRESVRERLRVFIIQILHNITPASTGVIRVFTSSPSLRSKRYIRVGVATLKLVWCITANTINTLKYTCQTFFC